MDKTRKNYSIKKNFSESWDNFHNGHRHPDRLDLNKMDELLDFYDFSPVACLSLDARGHVLSVNLTAVSMLKTIKALLIGRSIYDYVAWEDRDILYIHLRRLFKDQKRRKCELTIQIPGDRVIHAALESIYAKNRKGQKVCRSVMIDITEKKQAEVDLRRSRDNLEIRVQERTAEMQKLNQELKNEIEQRKIFEADLSLKSEKLLQEQKRYEYLSKKLVEILERERLEMANTLHDEVGQVLATIKTDLDFFKENINPSNVKLLDEIEKTQKRIRESMEYFSRLSSGFRPHVLQDLGLVPAIENIFQNIKGKTRLECHLYTKDIPIHISEEKDLAVYRIVQEAITNCLKHAGAKNLFVNLTKKDEFILITIEDDGKGFDYDKLAEGKNKREKLGISIMNERAIQLGGEFHIESQVGKGTQVIAEIPMK